MRRPDRKTLTALLLALPVAATACGTSPSGSVTLPTTSSPSQGIFAGVVRDPNGKPVSGALVSINGVESFTGPTGADGRWLVASPDLAQTAPGGFPDTLAGATTGLQASVIAPTFQTYFASLSVTEGALAGIDIVHEGLVPTLNLTSPTGQRTFVVEPGCTNPQVTVEGFAGIGVAKDFALDLVVILDRSGSTSRLAFPVTAGGPVASVLGVEVAAAKCLVGGLDYRATRVEVISFNDAATVDVPFSASASAILAGLDQVGPSIHGTNFEAALRMAHDEFLSLDALDSAQAALEGPDSVTSTPQAVSHHRAVVFLSDGIPTSHGVPRDVTDTNLTQSAADRDAAIAAAAQLGGDTGALLFCYSFIPENDPDRPRRTMPHMVAACGGGAFYAVPGVEQLEATLCSATLVPPAIAVTVRNATTGVESASVSVGALGFFSTTIPVALSGPQGAFGTFTNSIVVTSTIFPGTDSEVNVTRTVDVNLIDRATLDSLPSNSVDLAATAPEPVSASAFIARPSDGQPLGNDLVYSFLVATATAEFPDAVELSGVETFSVIDTTGVGTATATIDVDFVFKSACYHSDAGYCVLDPNNLPTTAEAALASVTAGQILFNSGNVGLPGCELDSIPPGTAGSHFEISFPVGQVVAFFLLPNRTIADYQAHPTTGLAPLFSIASLNPGGLQQTLAFRTAQGRTAPGDPTNVLVPGKATIVCFEDLAIALGGSDQDFNDVCFTVSDGVVGRVDGLGCAP